MEQRGGSLKQPARYRRLMKSLHRNTPTASPLRMVDATGPAVSDQLSQFHLTRARFHLGTCVSPEPINANPEATLFVVFETNWKMTRIVWLILKPNRVIP